MIPTILLALSPQTAPVPHADLHPADAAGYVGIHDLARTGTAYDQAPTFRFARDERVIEVVEAFTGEAYDAELASPGALFELLIRELPPEATAIGLPLLLEDTVGFSLSLQLDERFDAELRDGVRAFLTQAELSQIEDVLRGRLRDGAAALPSDLADLVGDDSGLASDAWGRPYTYEIVEDLGPVVRSLGADGEPGGEGFATDLELNTLGLTEPEPAIVEGLLGTIGIQLVLEFRNTAAAEQLMGLIDMTLLEAPEELVHEEFVLGEGAATLDGKQFSSVDAPLDVSGWVAVNGTRVVFGALATDRTEVAARLAGESPTLADSRTLTAGLDALGERTGVPIASVFGERGPLELYELALDAALDAGLRELIEREESVPGAVWGLLESFETDGRPVVQRQTLDASGFVTETLRPGAPTPSRYFPRGGIPRDDLAVIGADAAAVHATQIDLVAVYDLLLEIGAGFLGVDPEAYHQQGAELLGIDLRRDLLAHVEPTLVATLDPIRGPATPRVMLYAGLTDPDRVATSLATLVDSVAAAFPDDFSANTRPYRGMPLARLGLRGLDLGPVSIEPSFGVVGDRLVFGLSGASVKKELRRLDADELEAHPLLDPERMPWADDLSSVGYLDWAGFLAAGYDAGRTFAAFMGPSELDDLPLSLEELPDGSLLTDYFAPSIWRTRQAPAGQLAVATASIGPEFGIGVQLLTQSLSEAFVPFGLGNPPGMAFEAPAPAPEAPDEGEATREALRQVSVALQIHFYEFDGTYPATLGALSEATPNFPRGCLDGETLPDDAWGNPLRYAPTADATGYRLWSTGADGVDQSGAGDDLLTEVP